MMSILEMKIFVTEKGKASRFVKRLDTIIWELEGKKTIPDGNFVVWTGKKKKRKRNQECQLVKKTWIWRRAGKGKWEGLEGRK